MSFACSMISEFEGLIGSDPRTSSWEKVTRRIVDPITFACHVNVTYVPRIEDCSYETTNIAIGQPRFGQNRLTVSKCDAHRSSSTASSKKVVVSSKQVKNDENAWKPHQFPINNKNKSRSPPQSPFKHSKNHVQPTKSGGSGFKGATLGAFFLKDNVQKVIELDNQSLSSRSMNSRSVSERSNAERSKSEEKMKSRRVHRADGSVNTSEIQSMMSIDEQSASEFSERNSRSGLLGQTLNQGSKDEKTLKAARESKRKDKEVTNAAVSESNGLKDKSRKPKKTLKSILKRSGLGCSKGGGKLGFKEGHDICEVPTLDDKEWYRDWDDIWYSEEELGDMRYRAFLEEAGLDVDEYMNM